MDEYDNEIIGIQEVPSGNLNANVGYVIIPKGIDQETFIEDALRVGRLSINGGMGYGDFHDVPCDREVLQRIKFPKIVGEYGSPVVWVNIPKHNKPVIVACLKHDDEFHSLKEGQRRITKGWGSNMVDMDFDPKEARLIVTVTGSGSQVPQIIHRMSGPGNESQYIIDITGEVLIQGSNKIVQISPRTVETAVLGQGLKVVARTKLDSAFSTRKDEDGQEAPPVNRWTYEDEYNNKIYCNEDRIQIKAEDSSEIVFGDEEENEPLVKGETLVEKLGELIDAITQLTVSTAFGPSGTPINTASFTQIKQNLDEMLSELTKTE